MYRLELQLNAKETNTADVRNLGILVTHGQSLVLVHVRNANWTNAVDFSKKNVQDSFVYFKVSDH